MLSSCDAAVHMHIIFFSRSGTQASKQLLLQVTFPNSTQQCPVFPRGSSSNYTVCPFGLPFSGPLHHYCCSFCWIHAGAISIYFFQDVPTYGFISAAGIQRTDKPTFADLRVATFTSSVVQDRRFHEEMLELLVKLSAEAGYAACMQTIFSSDVMALQTATSSGFLPVLYAPQNGKVAGRRCDSVMVFKWLSDDARKVGSNMLLTSMYMLRFCVWPDRAIHKSVRDI